MITSSTLHFQLSTLHLKKGTGVVNSGGLLSCAFKQK